MKRKGISKLIETERDRHDKKYIGSSNILNPTLSLSPNFCSIEFPIKRTKLIEFGLKDQSSIKIKPLIITCFYVGSNINKKGLPDGLSEKYIIAQSFSNLLFNMNFKKEINYYFRLINEKI